jgi:hypothetical protein
MPYYFLRRSDRAAELAKVLTEVLLPLVLCKHGCLQVLCRQHDVHSHHPNAG